MLGTMFLNERITTQALAGMVVIALGLAAIDGRLFRPRSNHHRSK
jgi:hypothetical protein